MPAVETDALVIGAGPAGLFQVFQLGLQGIRCHVVDVLPQAGGQCAALYPDKPIYDIPALACVSGLALTQRLLEQIKPFAPQFHFGHEVVGLMRCNDASESAQNAWTVSTRGADAAGPVFKARTVFIAAGVGAFVPRTLKLEGEAGFDAQHLHTAAIGNLDPSNPIHSTSRFKNARCVVVGNEGLAVATAITLAQSPVKGVSLVHRKDEFEATEPELKTLAALRENGQIQVVLGQPIGLDSQQLRVAKADDTEVTLPLDDLFVCLGLSPRLGPLTGWGLSMHKRQIRVDPASMATNLEGIYAIGDINDYPGKRKLIVCAFHEATLAAFAAAARVFPDQTVRLEYTTSSRLLQSRLGV
jgi:thioredoxin reductase (NADPH)